MLPDSPSRYRSLPAALLFCLSASLPLVHADEVTAQASATYYGQACSSNMAPPFQVVGVPRLGTTFWIETLSGHRLGDAMGTAEILLGVSNTRLGGLTLPYDIGPFSDFWNTYCGFLLQSWDAMVPVPGFRGAPQTVRVAFPVPNDANLIGVTVYAQVARHTYTSLVRSSTHSLSRGARLVAGR